MKTKTSLCAGAALGMLMLGAGAAQAQDTTTAWKGAPQWTNDDVQFKVRGRILIDAVFQKVDRQGALPDYDTRNIRGRQVFIGVEGKLNNYIAYKAEGGFVNGGTSSWDDVVIEFKPNDMTSIMVGNIKAAGLENLTSTRFTTFMDRGPYGDFGPGQFDQLHRRQQHRHGQSGQQGTDRLHRPRLLRPDPERREQAAHWRLWPLPQPRR
jgi:phosphate-selective porin OprO/OprP